MKNKPYFPMFIDLSDKNIVVVGGGNIATRRVKTLLSFTRNIRVIAPKVTMEMMELGKAGYVELITRPVKRTDFAMAYMVIAATKKTAYMLSDNTPTAKHLLTDNLHLDYRYSSKDNNQSMHLDYPVTPMIRESSSCSTNLSYFP